MVSFFRPFISRNLSPVAQKVGNAVPEENFEFSSVNVPAQKYYVDFGSTDTLPQWINATSNVTNGLWDSTEKISYSRLNNAAGGYIAGSYPFAYFQGPYGKGTSYAPRVAGSQNLIMKCKARFTATVSDDVDVHMAEFVAVEG